MASRTILMLLSLVLATGCAQIETLLKPTPHPRPPRHQEAPPSRARPEHLEPPPRLAPQVDSDREKRLMEEVNTMIQRADRTLLSIDQQKLKADQSETYQTIQSFLAQAREAATNKDFQQAMNLSQKAHVLSDELSKAVR